MVLVMLTMAGVFWTDLILSITNIITQVFLAHCLDVTYFPSFIFDLLFLYIYAVTSVDIITGSCLCVLGHSQPLIGG